MHIPDSSLQNNYQNNENCYLLSLKTCTDPYPFSLFPRNNSEVSPLLTVKLDLSPNITSKTFL